MGEEHFRLLGTNGFHAQEKNERFNAAGLRCRKNFKNRELKQQRRQQQRQRKRHLKINIWEMATIL